jgi:hypothetical protein
MIRNLLGRVQGTLVGLLLVSVLSAADARAESLIFGSPGLAEMGRSCRFKLGEQLPRYEPSGAATGSGPGVEITIELSEARGVAPGQRDYLKREAWLATLGSRLAYSDFKPRYGKLRGRFPGLLDLAIDPDCKRLRWQGLFFDVILDEPTRIAGEVQHPVTGRRARMSIQRVGDAIRLQLDNALEVCEHDTLLSYVLSWKPRSRPAPGAYARARAEFDREFKMQASAPQSPPGPPVICPK